MKTLNKYIASILIAFSLFSCKKDKKTSPEQYYGEPIATTQEYFPMQELFDFSSRPAVSPDGRYLAYEIAATISTEKQGVWIANLQTGEKYMLKKYAFCPSWGPDSRQLCYINGNLYISNLTGKITEQLTQDTRCLQPDWHRTRNKIVYDDAFRNIYATDIATNNVIEKIVDRDIGGAQSGLVIQIKLLY